MDDLFEKMDLETEEKDEDGFALESSMVFENLPEMGSLDDKICIQTIFEHNDIPLEVEKTKRKRQFGSKQPKDPLKVLVKPNKKVRGKLPKDQLMAEGVKVLQSCNQITFRNIKVTLLKENAAPKKKKFWFF